jgi:hypothetical protein
MITKSMHNNNIYPVSRQVCPDFEVTHHARIISHHSRIINPPWPRCAVTGSGNPPVVSAAFSSAHTLIANTHLAINTHLVAAYKTRPQQQQQHYTCRLALETLRATSRI